MEKKPIACVKTYLEGDFTDEPDGRADVYLHETGDLFQVTTDDR